MRVDLEAPIMARWRGTTMKGVANVSFSRIATAIAHCTRMGSDPAESLGKVSRPKR
jgi:hypothetical protein